MIVFVRAANKKKYKVRIVESPECRACRANPSLKGFYERGRFSKGYHKLVRVNKKWTPLWPDSSGGIPPRRMVAIRKRLNSGHKKDVKFFMRNHICIY